MSKKACKQESIAIEGRMPVKNSKFFSIKIFVLLHNTPDFALDVGKLLPDFVGGRELEGSCAGNNLAVVIDVLDSAETVTDGILK